MATSTTTATIPFISVPSHKQIFNIFPDLLIPILTTAPSSSLAYLWARDMLNRKDLAAERHSDIGKLIHGHHLFCPEVQGLDVIRHHDPFVPIF